MGVPRFYRWLRERWPLTVKEVDGAQSIPPLDYLHVDMNGIIHRATHPNKGNRPTAPLPLERVVRKVVVAIDDLVHTFRPRLGLILAIDGAAPRAKINQQRTRRYLSSRSRLSACEKEKTDPTECFDSNAITPGTSFMVELCSGLHSAFQRKLSEDEQWSRLKLVFSGVETPGEGEHKILDIIRSLSQSFRPPSPYDPRPSHAIFGLDADLILLALGTHEPSMMVIREVESKPWLELQEDRPWSGPPPVQELQSDFELHYDEGSGRYEMLYVGLLREYFAMEFVPLLRKQPMPQDSPPWTVSLSKIDVQDEARQINNIIDDFLLLAMLVGNDFLPGCPAIDIAKGGLDVMLQAYKTVLRRSGEFLTNVRSSARPGSLINFPCFREFLEELALFEVAELHVANMAPSLTRGISETEVMAPLMNFGDDDSDDEAEAHSSSIVAQESTLAEQPNEGKQSLDVPPTYKVGYYTRKLELEYNTPKDVEELVLQFCKGLAWTLQYYTSGVPDWKWFFPGHYAPFVSDMAVVLRVYEKQTDFGFRFEVGEPYRPLTHLLAVLPPGSAPLLPPSYTAILQGVVPASGDGSSEGKCEDADIVIDLHTRGCFPGEYEIKIDDEGVRQEWEAVVQLPFLPNDQLLRAVAAANRLIPPASLEPPIKQRDLLADSWLFHGGAARRGSVEAIAHYLLGKTEKQKVPQLVEDSKDADGVQIAAPLEGVALAAPTLHPLEHQHAYPGWPTFTSRLSGLQISQAKTALKLGRSVASCERMQIVLPQQWGFLSSSEVWSAANSKQTERGDKDRTGGATAEMPMAEEANESAGHTLAKALLGGITIAPWPHSCEGRVEALSCSSGTWSLSAEGEVLYRSFPTGHSKWTHERDDLISFMKKRKGIVLEGEERFLLHVRHIIGTTEFVQRPSEASVPKGKDLRFGRLTCLPLRMVAPLIFPYQTHGIQTFSTTAASAVKCCPFPLAMVEGIVPDVLACRGHGRSSFEKLAHLEAPACSAFPSQKAVTGFSRVDVEEWWLSCRSTGGQTLVCIPSATQDKNEGAVAKTTSLRYASREEDRFAVLQQSLDDLSSKPTSSDSVRALLKPLERRFVGNGSAAARLGLSKRGLVAATSWLAVRTSKGPITIGIPARIQRTSAYLPGWTFKSPYGSWLYTEVMVETLLQYFTKFPWLRMLCDGAGRSGTISWPDFLAVLRTHEMIPSDADPDAEEIVALSLLEAAHEWSIAQNAWRDGPLRPSHTSALQPSQLVKAMETAGSPQREMPKQVTLLAKSIGENAVELRNGLLAVRTWLPWQRGVDFETLAPPVVRLGDEVTVTSFGAPVPPGEVGIVIAVNFGTKQVANLSKPGGKQLESESPSDSSSVGGEVKESEGNAIGSVRSDDAAGEDEDNEEGKARGLVPFADCLDEMTDYVRPGCVNMTATVLFPRYVPGLDDACFWLEQRLCCSALTLPVTMLSSVA